MSLTSFLENQDVREKFVHEFPKPKFTLKKDILASPKTQHYGLIGTSFDYLLRFYIKHLNPGGITRQWIGEAALNSPMSPILQSFTQDMVNTSTLRKSTGEVSIINLETWEELPYKDIGVGKKVNEIIERAKKIYENYLSSGQMTDEVIEIALLLAQIDPIYRIGYIDENLGIVDQEDIADLRALISLVEPETFHAKDLCLVNPTFGASKLVRGADADLIIDGILIDIKTTKNLKFNRDEFLQLMGYYVLYKISGISEVPDLPKIEKMGIYYSRYAELYTFPVRDVVTDETLPAFIDWFKQRATAQFAPRVGKRSE